MSNNFGRDDPEKRHAHHILDMVKAGRMVSREAVMDALDVLGEVCEPEVRARVLEPQQ